jgi:hypothetical protein
VSRGQRPNRGLNLETTTEGTVAILGTEIIRDLIIGIAEEIIAILDLLPAKTKAGTLDVWTVVTDIQTAETDAPTAGIGATIVVTGVVMVNMTEILEIILEIVAGRTVIGIMEAAETRGCGPGK